MALQIPKPSLDVNISASAAKNAASGAVSNATAGANDVAESPVAPSTPAPAASNIEETPSIKPIEPKPPVAPPPVMVKTVNLKLEFSGCDPAHTKWWNPGVISKKTIKKELDEVYDWHVKTNSTWFKRVSPY